MTPLALCWMILAAGPALGPPGPGSSLAEPAAAPEVGQPADAAALDLRAALRLGLERARAVRQGRLDTISARAQVTQALGALQPQVDFNASYSRFESARSGFQTGAGSSATSNRELSVSVDQLLFDGLQSLFTVYRARQDARAAEYREFATQLDVAQQIIEAFFGVLRQDALLRLQEQLVAQAERQVAQTEARLAEGLASRLDLMRIEVERANAGVELTAAASDYAVALSRLRNLLLWPAGEPLRIADTLPIPPVEMALDEALAAARGEAPGVAAAAAGRRSREHAAAAATWNRWATFRVTGSFERFLDSSRNVDQEYVLSASVSVPLWNGQSGEAAETAARASLRRAEEEYLRVVEQTALEVEQAHLTWSDSSARFIAAEAAARLAAESLTQTEESFRLEVASPLDVSNARTEFARAETNRIQARFDRDLASLNLRLAIGRMPLEPAEGEAPDA